MSEAGVRFGPVNAATIVPTAAAWRSVAQRFVSAAAAHPNRSAVISDAAELTFAELEQRSALVAGMLAARAVGPETVVGLCLSRGMDLVAAILGVLRAGGAYLPLEPAYPADRLAYMAADSGMQIVLADAATASKVAELNGVLRVDTRQSRGTPPLADVTPVRPENLAYVIYTSGSTGRPKGVQVSHGSLGSLLDALIEAGVYSTAPGRVGWNASVGFDASVQQWLRVCRGETLVVIEEQTRSEPPALARLIAAAGLTDLDITPAHLALVIDHLPQAASADRPLRLLIGGEAIGSPLWDRLAELGRAGVTSAVNLYGPTECTVDATAEWIASGLPSIGEALPGVRLHLLDEALQPVEVGATGEIYLAGTGVARGYRGRPGLTAERFVADLAVGDGSRMYRTGDRARRDPDGALRYLGRTDDQVKVRGHRIELGEVTAALLTQPGVTDATVVLRHDLPGGTGLVAYFCSTAQEVTAEQLRAALSDVLPEFMMPAAFAMLDHLPTTVNGKVDRARLPPPFEKAHDRPAADPGFEAPAGPTEQGVAAVWSSMLGVPQISATDNFFLVGGDSALAIQLAARLRRSAGVAVPLIAVFENPRLRDLAAYLDRLAT
jgi:amino acid adenylation domain-containing protein